MAQTDPLIGQQIGNYQIVAPIAAGAFGVVYKARHQHIQERVVAIKTLHVYLASQEEHEQFAREAEILEKLRHPNILALLDFGFFQNRPYLITAYASGGSLRHLLRSTARKPLPWDLAFHLLQQTGQGLHHAHQQRVIHRDLKPENILLSDRQDVLIADFGISSMLTSTSSVAYSREIGTPSYMAPEQFRGEMSAESDQYALACMAYEMVTGRRPFEATNDAIGFMHINTPPPPLRQFNPQVFPHVEQAILRALAKGRRERFSDLAAFIDALRTGTTPLSTSSVATELAAYRPVQHVSTEQKGQEGVSSYTLKHLLDMGNGLFKRENYEQAHTAYERALQSYPRSVDALEGKGDVLRKLKRHMDALAVYDEALGIDPNSVAVLLSKGQLFEEMELHQEALATFDQVISRRPKDALPLALCAKAATLSRLGRTQDAFTVYSEALDIDPQCAEARNGREKILQDWKNLPAQQALATLDQVISHRSKDPIIPLMLCDKAIALLKLGRTQDAFIVYSEALDSDPQCAEAKNGKEKILQGWSGLLPEQTLNLLDKVLSRRPEDGMILAYKGHALSRLGRYNDAFALYNRAQEFDPGGNWKNKMPVSLKIYKQELDRYRESRPATIIGLRLTGGVMLLCIVFIGGRLISSALNSTSPYGPLLGVPVLILLVGILVFFAMLFHLTPPKPPSHNS